MRDDERCGRSKEVRTPELIGQRVRVRVTMLRFSLRKYKTLIHSPGYGERRCDLLAIRRQ